MRSIPATLGAAAKVRSAASRSSTDLNAAERIAHSVEHKYHQAMALLAVANASPSDPAPDT